MEEHGAKCFCPVTRKATKALHMGSGAIADTYGERDGQGGDENGWMGGGMEQKLLPRVDPKSTSAKSEP